MESAKKMCQLLHSFLLCDHFNSDDGGFEHVCDNCSETLAKGGKCESNYLPTLEKFIHAHLEAQDSARTKSTRALAHFTSNVLSKCISTSGKFQKLFEKNATPSAKL